MKTKLAALLVLLFGGFACNTVAQVTPAIRLGGTVGLFEEDVDDHSVFVPFARYYGGISITPTIAKNHSAQFQINYINRAFQRQLIVQYAQNLYASHLYNTFIDALEFKALYVFTLKNRFHLMGGFFFSTIFHEKTVREYSYIPLTQPRYEPPTMNKSDFGVCIGASYDWFEKWQLEAGFSYGLQPIYVNPEPFNNIQFKTFTFGINRKIGFKK